MNKRSLLLVLLVQFLISSAFSKSIIPKQLQGFWSFQVNNKGDWNGTLIGGDYVEHFYEMCKVDSLKEKDGIYKIWLTSERKAPLTLEIKKLGNNKASLKYGHWQNEKICSWQETDPDIKFFGAKNIPPTLKQNWIYPAKQQNNFSITEQFKLQQNGKKWNILWAGSYLEKEYRLLVKDQKTYKMVYIVKQPKSLKVNDVDGEMIYEKQASNPLVYAFLGNWINEETNDWHYGFFKDFAIYNQEAYTYQKLAKKGNNISLQLLGKGKERNVQINIKNDSVAQLTDSEGTKNVYLYKHNLKPAKIQDTSSFSNNHFSKVDTAIISGYLRNPSSNQPFSVILRDVLTEKDLKYYGDLDSNGFFEVKVPVLNTTSVVLDCDRTGSGRWDVLEPGERYFYFEDAQAKQKLTMGNHANFHNEMVNYSFYAPFRITDEEWRKKTSSKTLEFLNINRAEYKKSIQTFDNYLTNNPKASNKFKYFVSEFNKYEVGYPLIQRMYHLDSTDHYRFPEAYISFLKDTLYKNTPPKPFTLIREFVFFKNDLFSYLRDRDTSYVKWNDLIEEMVLNNHFKTTAAEREALLAEVKINRFNESKERISPVKRLPKAQSELASSFRKSHFEEIKDAANKKLMFVSQQNYLKFTNSIADEDLRDLYFAHNSYDFFNYNSASMPDDVFKLSMLNIKNSIYRNRLSEMQESYLKLAKVAPEYVESLKRTDHLKSSKNADSIFAALIRPYKGKVIYADFWGTWCGPCKGEMPYVKDVKDALKGKDVIFMYFANNSPEESWKNIINENKLTGENAVHYRLPSEQQSILENRLSITSFPTYILIDRDGNINTMKPPRPSDNKVLVAAIDKLLNSKTEK
jgi:thiol-disulfide isomerase/thioredoxin